MKHSTFECANYVFFIQLAGLNSTQDSYFFYNMYDSNTKGRLTEENINAYYYYKRPVRFFFKI